MAKLKEILEAESQRSSLEQCRVIHLFQEGTFYRAYEWSAWLAGCISSLWYRHVYFVRRGRRCKMACKKNNS